MKKKKRSLNKLFQNNKFLIILALVISTITWVYMSMGTTNDTTVTISNIPIQIELPDQLDNNGLQVFRDAEQTATVTVTGSRAVLGSIGTKDITVTGATNGIDSAGKCCLQGCRRVLCVNFSCIKEYHNLRTSNRDCQNCKGFGIGRT